MAVKIRCNSLLLNCLLLRDTYNWNSAKSRDGYTLTIEVKFTSYSKVISSLLLSMNILPNLPNADCPKSKGAFRL